MTYGLSMTTLTETSPKTLRTLSIAELRHFETRGFVYVRKAFAAQDALEMREQLWSQLKTHNGVDRDDPSTWSRPWFHLNRRRKSPIYRRIGSERLLGAIDDILGPAHWNPPDHWGMFLASPPTTNGNWSVPQEGWHWDSRPGPMAGIVVITFLSSVKPRGGGTLFVEGAQRLLEHFFDAGPSGAERELKAQFVQSHPWLAKLHGLKERSARGLEFLRESPDGLRVREAIGEPGDALICPSWFYHNRPSHHEHEPRFMRLVMIHRKCSNLL